MNTFAKLGVAVAFVTVVTLIGISLSAPPNPGPVPVEPTPAPTEASTPTPSPTQTGTLVEWSGPVRPDLGQAVVAHSADEEDGGWSWADPGDAAMGWVDITAVGFWNMGGGRGQWNIELASWPPPATEQDGADLIVAHGLVFDTTSDGVADYVVGVDDDTPRRGDFHAWVTNLATGRTEERSEPPYGDPVEFGHFDRVGSAPTVSLFFLYGSAPAGFDIKTLRYYAWTSATEADRVVAWDYAPDVAWLGSPLVNGWPSAGHNPPGEYSFGASANPNVGRYGWMHNGFQDNAEGEGVSLEFTWGESYPSGTTPVTVAGYGGTFHESVGPTGRRRQVWNIDIEGTTFSIILIAEPKTTAAQLAEARAIIESIRAAPPADGDGVRVLIFTLPAGWDSG